MNDICRSFFREQPKRIYEKITEMENNSVLPLKHRIKIKNIKRRKRRKEDTMDNLTT